MGKTLEMLVVFTLIMSAFMQCWGTLGFLSGGVYDGCLPKTHMRSEPVLAQKSGVPDTKCLHRRICGFI